MKSVLLLVLATWLSGCIQFNQLSSDEPPSDNEAVIVLGVSPPSDLAVETGELRNGRWHCTSLLHVANVSSEDGFVVLKLHARTGTENYAIGQISGGGTSYGVGNGTDVPVFHAQPGTVTYIGAIRLFQLEKSYRIAKDASVNRSAAVDLLSRKYPRLSKDLKDEPLEIVPADGGC